MAATPDRPRRRRSVTVLIVVGTLVGLLAVFAVWAKRQLLETNTYAQTSTQLLENSAIRQAVASFLVNELYAHVDVEAQLQKALPPKAQVLAGPAAGGLRQVADTAANKALEQPAVQQLWEKANLAAHTALLHVVEGGGPVVSTGGGDVTLDLGTLVEQIGAQVGVNVAGKIPEGAAQIDVLQSNQLTFAQDAVNLLQKLAILLPLLALGLYGLAIYLAEGRRREALRAAGFGFITIGLIVLVARKLGGSYLVDSLTTTASAKPAAQSAWDILTSLLKDGAWAMVGYGVVIVVAAWLAGPKSLPTELRRWMTSGLRDRRIAYAVLAVVVLLVLLWNPTQGTSRLLPSLVLLALLVGGLEALRAQALREFPDETGGAFRERMGAAFASVRGAARREPTAAAAPDPEAVRLEQLERLARLRESGTLDDEEFRREKQRVLGGA